MEQIYEPKQRDEAIEVTCSNLIMAGKLQPFEVPIFMGVMRGWTDRDLAATLCGSHILLCRHLEKDWNLN